MLIALIAATLLAFLAGQALPKAIIVAPAFWAHLVLAVGVMTLITAAMQHFVPVLTRSRGAGRWMARLPFLMLAAGGMALAVFSGRLDFIYVMAAAALALIGVVGMLVWMRDKARRTLGKPHPGLAWYVAAMACLGLGLLAAMAIPLLPAWHAALRAFHIHINLYGFVGLTAIGTLQVLMPTAANQADPQVSLRLRADLKWALAGSLLLALGQAFLTPLAWLGGALWFWVIGRMGAAWWRLHRAKIFAWHGAEPVLAAMAIPLLPAWHTALRAFHIHINLYGFVGLTAIGTLQVLMPTAANQADPQVSLRLRADLKWALAGSLLLALGQVFLTPLAWLGGALWFWVIGRMGAAWWRLHRAKIFAWHGAEPVLAAALFGFACALAGVLIGLENLAPLTIFLPAFLMPLVTGAAGQLGPVWIEAGRTAARHAADRAKITRWNSARALLFLTAAVLPLLGYQCSGMPALTALVWFGIVFAVWVYRDK